MKTNFIVAVLLAGWLQPTDAQPVRYVNHAATGANDGSSWTNAFMRLQDAINAASDGDEIWVAKGVYKPTQPQGGVPDVFKTFYITKSIAIYGGFQATETLLSQRDVAAHVTILSGDLDNNDLNSDGNQIAEVPGDLAGQNAYHVVWMENAGASPRLDGFVVTAGWAQGINASSFIGAGLYNSAEGAGTVSNPQVFNCRFSGNDAYAGGAIENRSMDGGTVNGLISNCHFSGNSGYATGGAMGNTCIGPGMANTTLINCIFSDNGGELTLGGALNNHTQDNGTANPTLLNCVFYNNRGAFGGAILNSANGGTASPVLTNCSFSGNLATENLGGALYNLGSGTVHPVLTNCIFWGNLSANAPSIFNATFSGMGQISYSLLEESACPSGMACGPGMVFNQNPLFADTASGNLRLLAGSPAIDRGDNNALPPDLLSDPDGNARIFNATGLAVATVDMGAYEFGAALSAGVPAPPGEIRVFPNPNAGAFTLEWRGGSMEELRFSLFAPDGRLVQEIQARADATGLTRHFDLHEVPAGVYLLRVRSGGSMYFARVVIQP